MNRQANEMTTARVSDTGSSASIQRLSGSAKPKKYAPKAIGTTARDTRPHTARPRSAASQASCRSTGRARSTAMSPVRTRSASSVQLKIRTTAIMPCDIQVYVDRLSAS